MAKPRILIVTESPHFASGYSGVARNLAKSFTRKFDIGFLAWGWSGYVPTYYEMSERVSFGVPVKFYHVMGNRFGTDVFDVVVDSFKPDVIFYLADTFMLMGNLSQQVQKYRGKICQVFYFPVDGDCFPLPWVPFLEQFDGLVCFTEYGKREIEKVTNTLNVNVLHHGVDTNIFKPVSPSEKKALKERLLPFAKDKFLISWVGRNFVRKNPQAIIQALAYWENSLGGVPKDLAVYMHTADNDPAGFPLSEVIKRDYPEATPFVFFPANHNINDGIPVQMLANIYQASDLFVSTAMGEGWGLPITEAMASKVPVIVPDNSACKEQVGLNQERGIAVECPTGLYATHNVVQRLIDHRQLAEAMKRVYENPESVKDTTQAAFAWTQDHAWADLGRNMTNIISGILERRNNSITPSMIHKA